MSPTSPAKSACESEAFPSVAPTVRCCTGSSSIGQGAGLEYESEVLGFGERELAADLGAAPVDALRDPRRRLNGSVEHDGQQLILAGDLSRLPHLVGEFGERGGPLTLELHVDLGLVVLIEADLGS